MPSVSGALKPAQPDTMARRSYLQRIAEPLRAGDPVLFAVPHAGADETRPAAQPSASIAAAPPGRATLRRRATGRDPQHAPVADRATRSAPLPEAAAPADAILSAAPDAATSQPPPAPRELPTQPRPAAEARTTPSAPDHPAATEQQREPAPAARAIATAASPPPSWSVAPTPLTEPPPAGIAAARTSETETSAAAAHPTAAAIVPEPIVAPQPTPASMPSAVASAAPRIHIGTVEVRASAPAPAPAPPAATTPRGAPRGDATPISRGYAWRFGLIQG